MVVDPRPYMTYQPFLPEVLAGSVEARHAAVSLRRHLHRARLVAGTVTAIDHAHRTVTVHPAEGPDFALGYDIIVVTAGAVTRRLAIPGVAEQAIGMKHVEEAVAIRDRLLTPFDRAAAGSFPRYPAGPVSGWCAPWRSVARMSTSIPCSSPRATVTWSCRPVRSSTPG